MMMKRKNSLIKRGLSIVLLLIFVFSFSAGVFAATWRTGNVPENGRNTSAIVVSLTNKNKDAYIKIHTYADKNRFSWLKDKAVKERNCTLSVTMRDKNNRWVWENSINTGSGGKKMKLGKDHSVYRIYLRHPNNIHCWDAFHYCPRYWGVECVSNCSVK